MAISSQEIKSACPGCSSDFVVACLDKELDIASCTSQWMQELALLSAASQEQLEALTAKEKQLTDENTELKASVADLSSKLEDAMQRKVGVSALAEPAAKAQAESPSAEYWKQVRELQSSGKTRAQAMSHVNKYNPELREAMVAQANA